jgi:predicted permease
MNPRWRRYLRFFGRDVAADVDDELRFHLEMRARDYEARGFSPDDARRAARERFGDYDAVNTSLLRHDYAHAHAERRRDLMDDLRQDLRYALRSLRRAPGFALVAILTLALGIGANTAVFSVVDAVVVRALPYPRADRLVALTGSTLAEFQRIRALSTSYLDVASYRAASINLSGDGDPERLDGAIVTPNVFRLLGVPAAHGRGFIGDESDVGRIRVVVLSDALWRRRFGGDPSIVGRSIMVEGAPYEVLGVMPPGFGFPTADIQLWIPINMPAAGSGMLWGNAGFKLVARLRDAVTPAQAEQELRATFAHIRLENPIWDPGPTYGTAATVQPLQANLVGSTRTMLILLLGVVGVVLLIACANVANLLLVRAAARQKEVAVRMALGGGRGRLVRQFLTESVVLAACGGALGLFVAWVGVRELLAALPPDVPRLARIGIDPRVLVFTSALVVMTGLLFGLLPALRASRDVAPALRDSARSSTGGSQRRIASLLVAGEIAAAVLLVIGATLLIRSARALGRVDPGFRAQALVTARLTPPRNRYLDPTSPLPLYDGVIRKLASLPGVQSVAATDRLPLARGGVPGIALRVEGQAEDLGKPMPSIEHYQVVTPGYHRTMAIPLLAGRLFTGDDRAGAPPVVVVSQSFARQFWPNESAVGKRVGYPWPSDWMTIVGVVGDAQLDSLTGPSRSTIYRPFAQAPALNMTLVVRTAMDPSVLAAELRRAVTAVDPTTPLSDVIAMQTIVDRSAARQHFTMLLLGLFATLALVLGSIGIYGVMSYSVAQRQREIGIRMALGAAPGDARAMILREACTIALAGIAVGIVVALTASRLLGGLLYGVRPTDPLTFALVPMLLAGAALVASYLPARRATSIDPTTALRAD